MDLIKDNLLSYQIEHTYSLVTTLRMYGRAIDASSTGIGKTHIAIAICKILNLRPIIICPKSVVINWFDVTEKFKVKPYGIANYEIMQNCRYFKTKDLKASKCRYVKRRDNSFKWETPDDVLIIFDEAHRTKNRGTINSNLLISVSDTSAKILLVSATICDKPKKFLHAGYCLNLYKSLKDGKKWINKVGKGFDDPMQGVHNVIFPTYGSRIKVSELKHLFPENKILAECVIMDCSKEIEEQYKLIEEAVNDTSNKEVNSNALAKIMYLRQKIETLKIPTLIKIAKEYLNAQYAIAIFVNFTFTLLTLMRELNTKCVVYGDQTLEERMFNIKQFNDDISQIIILNIQSGNSGISLHDTKGQFKRVSIISPSWSAINTLQALGRIYRANTKTECLQKIIFCKDTIEEKICEDLKEKIKHIGYLNDGNYDAYQIENLIELSDSNKPIKPISDKEKLEIRITVLKARKDRLGYELKEVIDELNSLEYIIKDL
jgi:superfamily II DNA or RNA helicase